MIRQPAFTILETILYAFFIAAGLLLARMSVQAVACLAVYADDTVRVEAYHRSAFFYLYQDLREGRLISASTNNLCIEQCAYDSRWRERRVVVVYDWQGDGLRRAVNKDGRKGRRIYVAPVPHRVEIKEDDTWHYSLVYEPVAGICWRAVVPRS